MLRRFAIVSVLLLTLAGVSPAQDQKIGTKQELPEGVAASCVRVGTTGGMGSGTVIARRGKTALILTNQHVVPNDKRKIYVITGGQRYDGKFVAALDPNDADLALVTAEIPNPAVAIAQKSPEVGTKIRHFGGATGPQKGKITGETRWILNGKVNPAVDSDIFSVVGDSGSGLFNDNNELVGVHYARKGDPEADVEETVANSVRLDHIKKFTEPYLKSWRVEVANAK